MYNQEQDIHVSSKQNSCRWFKVKNCKICYSNKNMSYKIKHKSMIMLSATMTRSLSKCEKPSNILINVSKIQIIFNKTFNNTFVFTLKKP